MNTGIFGEGFPYSNFHALNMDWIIKIAKDFLDQYTHIQEIIANGEESLQTLTAEGLQSLQDKATALETALNDWYTVHQNYLDQTLTENVAEFIRLADIKAQETIASIPDDYTELSDHVDLLNSDFLDEDTDGFIPLNATWIKGSLNADGSVNTSTTWRLATSNIMEYDRVFVFKVDSGYTAQIAVFNSDNTVTRSFVTDATTLPAHTRFRASVYLTNEQTSDDPTDDYQHIHISSRSSQALKGAFVNISSTNRESYCGSNIFNLPLNEIFGVVPDVGLQNAPTTEAGLYFTVSKDTRDYNSTATAFYIARSGKIYVAMYWGSSWESWHSIPITDMVVVADTDTPNQSATYSHLLSNIKKNICMIASASNWDDTPTGRSGYFESRLYTDHYAIQKFICWNPWTEYYRVVDWNDSSVYADWGSIPHLPNMKILALGDSVCYGYRNSNKGFVGDLGLPYKNIGVSGASLSNIVTDVTNIPNQLLAENSYNPDIIIADGGINDYIAGASLGTVPTQPAVTDAQANALDRTTVMGAMGFLFYNMVKKFPKAQRFFLIPHKIYRPNVQIYYPTYNNSATPHYNYQELHDAQVAICNVYNVKVIDVYKDGIINTLFSQYVSNVDFEDDHSITYTEYVNTDGVHPLDYGYRQGYVPLVAQAIGIGTVK